jgi:hypothetical protein
MTVTFLEPTTEIIKKLRADSILLARIPASNIHSSFPVDTVDCPGIYITEGPSPMSQIVGSANRTSNVLVGKALWQLDCYSRQSTDQAKRIGLIACEALLPNLVTAGLFELNYTFERVTKNKLFDAFEATYTLYCPLREWRTRELV